MDVDAAKRSAGRAARTEAFAEVLIDMVEQPVLVLTLDLRVEHSNAAFQQAFGLRPHELEGRRLFELAGGRWDLPELRRAIERDLASSGSLDNVSLTQTFPGVGKLAFKVSARRVAQSDGEPLIVLTVSVPKPL